jgi:hypothetical protein
MPNETISKSKLAAPLINLSTNRDPAVSRVG